MSRYITLPENDYIDLKQNSERWIKFVEKRGRDNEALYVSEGTLMILRGDK
jgi:hypothetical protein